nr:hypothetical protein [Tanacetum cinerariifolium]
MRALVNHNLFLRVLLLLPKTQGENQPLERDLTFTTSNEGTTKTTPHPEGSHRDKDLGGNKPPADMEPLHTTDGDLSRTSAKYQEDQTQFSRLRYQSLTKNKGDSSYEGEPYIQPLILSYVDVRAILLSKDKAQESDKEVLAVGDEMDEDPQDDKEVRTPSPKQDQPTPSYVQESASDSSSPNLKRFDNILPLTESQLIRYLRKMSKGRMQPPLPLKNLLLTLKERLKNQDWQFQSHPLELGIQSALPAPEQASSQTSRRQQKHRELEPETRILDWNAIELSLKMSRLWSDINKEGMEALVLYLVAASMVKSPENARFSMKLKKLIAELPDQEKFKSKKVKLEALGYNMD